MFLNLGQKYSKALNATYLDEQGKDQIMVMGCYGIGVTRIIAASIEQQYDENGIIWPVSIAPYQILITPLNVKDDEIKTTADTIYNILSKEKFDILFDDRDETAGVKLKDADLIGIPLRITIGSKTLKEGKVELYVRKSKEVYKISKRRNCAKNKRIDKFYLSLIKMKNTFVKLLILAYITVLLITLVIFKIMFPGLSHIFICFHGLY